MKKVFNVKLSILALALVAIIIAFSGFKALATNYKTVERAGFSIRTVWVGDEDHKDLTRPDKVGFEIVASVRGVATIIVENEVVTENENWFWKSDNNGEKWPIMDMSNGNKIEHSLVVSEVDNYKIVISKSVTDGTTKFTVIYTYIEPVPPTVATPVAPKLYTDIKCNEIPNVIKEEIDGIVWDVNHDKDDFKYTITASAKEGYIIKDDVTTSWTLDYEIEVCDVDKPGVIDPEKPGVEIPTNPDENNVYVVAPEISVTCDKQAEVVLPSVVGLTYTKEDLENGNVKVSVEANKGYKLPKNAISEWEFKLPKIVKCIIPVTPTQPNIVDPEKPGTVVPGIEKNDVISPDPNYKIDCGKGLAIDLPKVEGIEYKQEAKDGYIIVKASAREGYAIAEDSVVEWKFELQKVVECDIEITPEIPEIVNPTNPGEKVPTEKDEDGIISAKPDYKLDCGKGLDIKLPEIKGLTYTKIEKDGYIIVVVSADEGYKIVEGSELEWEFKLPEIKKCPVLVTPVKPELNTDVDCEQDYKVILPTTKGIEYVKTIDGKTVTVVAKAKEGYQLKEGVTTKWKFDITNNEKCPLTVTPVKPELNTDVDCDEDYLVSVPGFDGVKEIEGLVYTKEVNGKTVKITAKVKEGYILKQRDTLEWTFNIENDTECFIKVTPIVPTVDKNVDCEEDYKLVIPEETDEIYYEVTWNGKVATVEAKAKDGCEIEDGIDDLWVIDTTNINDNCDTGNIVTPEKPNIIDPNKPGIPDVPEVDEKGVIKPNPDYEINCDESLNVKVPKDTKEITYKSETKDGYIIVSATANEGYSFAEGAKTEWKFELPSFEACQVPVAPTKPLPDTGSDNLVLTLILSISAIGTLGIFNYRVRTNN